jgi:hypothetical protein
MVRCFTARVHDARRWMEKTIGRFISTSMLTTPVSWLFHFLYSMYLRWYTAHKIIWDSSALKTNISFLGLIKERCFTWKNKYNFLLVKSVVFFEQKCWEKIQYHKGGVLLHWKYAYMCIPTSIGRYKISVGKHTGASHQLQTEYLKHYRLQWM